MDKSIKFNISIWDHVGMVKKPKKHKKVLKKDNQSL